MKVAIVGSRGIPAQYGGFETFTQEISVLLAQKGFEVSVVCDHSDAPIETYHGVKLIQLSTTKSKNPLRYYFRSIRKGVQIADVVIVTGTGGALFYFVNLFRKKVIITNSDGLESRRQKWSFLKRTFIKLTEKVALKFSNAIVADSKGIAEYINDNYSQKISSKVRIIEYGAHINQVKSTDLLNEYNLKPNEYYLVVSRLEPENNIDMIVKGFLRSDSTSKLAIVGNLSKNEYVENLRSLKNDRIIFLGGIYDSEKLNALRFFCKAYLHGHSVGGTNPSLLEALGSANICICHDNIFNREVTNDEMYYFSDENSVKKCIKVIENLSSDQIEGLKQLATNRIIEYYNWKNIADKYEVLLNEFIN